MLETLAIYTNPIEAHIVRGRLEAEGIPTYVIHEYHIWANWFYSNALGGVKVQINAADAVKAKETISKLENDEFEKTLEEYDGPFESLNCPKCESTSIKECRLNEKVTLIVLWAYGLPIPYVQGKLRCLNCGARWITKGRKSYSIFARLSAILLIALFYMVLIEGLNHVCKLHFPDSHCFQ